MFLPAIIYKNPNINRSNQSYRTDINNRLEETNPPTENLTVNENSEYQLRI